MSISLFPLLEKSTHYTPISSSHNEQMMQKAQQHLFEIANSYGLNLDIVYFVVIQPLMQAIFNSEQVDYSLISTMIDESQDEQFLLSKKELLEQVKVLEYVSNKTVYSDVQKVWEQEIFLLEPISV